MVQNLQRLTDNADFEVKHMGISQPAEVWDIHLEGGYNLERLRPPQTKILQVGKYHCRIEFVDKEGDTLYFCWQDNILKI